MNLKTVIKLTVLMVVGYYLAPFIGAIFNVNTQYCEQYDVYDEEEYIVGYGERLKAVSEGCY